MRWVWAVLTLVMLAPPALALSCLPTDVVRTFKALDADESRWGAVVGRLDFDERRLPQVDWDRQDEVPQEKRLRAQLIGHSLGPQGWKKPFQNNVSLYVLCSGPWCASPSSGQTYLVFLKREGRRHMAFAEPCGEKLVPRPPAVDLQRLHSCFVGGPCEEREF